uniref:Integrase catalytic domain-containing protein n=1 Tax=Tanacetum cinerariifolium TaxID=118510 RepID=A0A6L2P188_TANCI|nr:hypothetical protein [Tanacetum cinerariifolium]
MLNPSPDAGIESLFETTTWVDVQASTIVASHTLSLPTLLLPTIPTSSQVQQAPTPPTTSPSNFLQDLLNFGLLFGFNHQLKTLEANFSEFVQANQFVGAVSSIPGIIILDTYGDTVTLKRRHDDVDKDEEPFAGSDRRSKRRREGKEPESTSAPKEKTTKTTGKSTQGFLRHSEEIRKLTDVNINKLHQQWRSFVAVINKCLSGKSTGYDSLRLSQAQLHWGMYHKKNVDFSYLLEDFVYHFEHKDAKKNNEMYYLRLTKFGVMLPVELTNKDIKNSEVYKEYYAVASGATPPKTKACVRKTKCSSNTTIAHPTAAGTRLLTSAKGKQHAKAYKAKAYGKTHISQASGSGTDEGTGIILGVLDVPTKDSDEDISWKSSNEDDDDQDDDDQDESNDDDQDTDNDGDEFVHPKLSIHEEKETKDEESFDPIVQTPKNSDDEGNDNASLGLNVGGEEGQDAEDDDEELYRDVNINLKGRDVQMTDVHTTQEFEDTHVTLTPNLLNFGSLFGFDHLLKTLEANFSEFAQTNQFAGAVYSIPGIVERYMDQRMNEASDRLRDEAQAENEEILKNLDENIQKIIKEQVKEQVKVQVSKILPNIEKTVNEQLKAEVLTRSSNSSKTSYVVATDLSEMELKKILIKKMESNKSIQRSDEQRNLYNALVDAYESDKIILDTYRDTITLKRRRDDVDKDEEPFAESDWGSKRQREGKEPESTSALKEKTTKTTAKSTQGSNLIKRLQASHRVIPFYHFINNDLEYLPGGASSRKYTTFVTKTKAADYGHIKWIEDLFYEFAVNRASARDVYSKHRIIVVTELQIIEWHDYKHMDWIMIRKDDDKLYKFKEGDFKRLRIQDIEDMLLLLVQGKLTNLTPELKGSTQGYPLVSVAVLRYDKRSKSKNMGIVPNEIELILEHTQQGISHEVSAPVVIIYRQLPFEYTITSRSTDVIMWNSVYNAHNEVACLMLGRKTIGEVHVLLIEYENSLPKKAATPQVMAIQGDRIQKANRKLLNAKGNGKAKGKRNDKSYIPHDAGLFKNLKPSAKEHSTKDDTCHHCKELGHWKKNYPAYLAEFIKKKKQVGTANQGGRILVKILKIIFYGIVQQLIPPYTPQHNGVSERRNRTLFDMVRSNMNLTTLSLSFWDYALESAIRILNMLTTKKVDKTPYGLWYGKVSNLSYLKVWGCEALVKRDIPDKLQQRFVMFIFVGYPMEMMGYYFYVPPENKIIVARYAEFLDGNLLSQEVCGRPEELKEIQDKDTSHSENTSKIPMKVEDVNEHSLGDLYEPNNYKAAILYLKSNKWVDAMNAEMQSMKDNQVWCLVDLPPDCFIGLNHPRKVCKLQRSIYGLKQASRSWNERFDEEIKRFGFSQNLDKPYVYQKASGSNVTFLILYVNNIIIIGNHISSLQSVKTYVKKCFAMKDLVKATFILRIKIYRDRSKRLIGLSQYAYVDEVLKGSRWIIPNVVISSCKKDLT